MFSEWMNDKEIENATLEGPSLSMILPARRMLALPWPAHGPPLGREMAFQLMVLVWRQLSQSLGLWLMDTSLQPSGSKIGSSRIPSMVKENGRGMRLTSCVAFLFLH